LRDWVRRKLGSVQHELRVGRVAATIFDLAQRWHGMGSTESRLLIMAALLHDVGRVGGEKKHAQRGAAMILENSSLPLTSSERRRLAFLTRYHRGSVPEQGAEEILDPSGDDSATMRMLLGILRAADGLDSRSFAPPRLVMTTRGRVLTVFGYVEGEAGEAEELFGRRKKFRLLEEMLDCQVRTHWFSTEMAALVS
jgi:exopolyphosphatase/pppGpp-phosphohydrolase